MPLYMVLIGYPGAGKGTQAAILSEKKQIAHVSSGDMFRDNIKRKTELGLKVEAILSRGELVPDDLTIAMVRDRLSRSDCVAGAILDGFPRTPAQAGALNTMLSEFGGTINLVPYIKVREEILVERLTGRFTCKGPGQHVYHIKFNPPKVDGVCDVDGEPLYQRPDDTEEAVKTRLSAYMKNTAPLIEYYRQARLLVEISGEGAIEQVTAELLAAVAKASG